MTVLFLLALALLGFVMKLAALLLPARSNPADSWWVWSPLLSPNSMLRAPPRRAAARLPLRTVSMIVLLSLSYLAYWSLVKAFSLRGILLSYLAAPVILLIGESFLCVIALIWLPSGRLLPALHCCPPCAHGVADFWGRRWNLWFSDWFRYAVFAPQRQRPVWALVLVFGLSGLMHEWVINVPLYFVTGRNLFGSMMVYFLLQAPGVLIERRFLRGNQLGKTLFGWLVVLGPVPLVINEGLLRTLHLWPE